MNLTPYIEDLISRIDPEQEQALLDRWLDYSFCRNTDGPFRPFNRRKCPSGLDWPAVNINDTLMDEDLMVYYQLRMQHEKLCSGADTPMCIRPNYGVGTLCSMLGSKDFVMPREMNCLPNVIAIGEDGVRALLDSEVRLFEKGWGPRVLRTIEHMREILDKYPILDRFVLMDHPDMQGPMDNVELLWGSSVFYALYDDPDTVHALLQRVTDYMNIVLDTWYGCFPNRLGVLSNSNYLLEGSIMIRNDSAMNLSPEMFEEYIMPYDAQLLKKYKGGVHFCGRGDHFIEALSRQEGLTAVNMSQPHLNDMQTILKNTVDKNITLTVYGFPDSLDGHKTERLYFMDGFVPKHA